MIRTHIKLIFATLFLLILLVSQDYLFLTWSTATFVYGFPSWLPYFLLLHIMFAVTFYFFQKKGWKE